MKAFALAAPLISLPGTDGVMVGHLVGGFKRSPLKKSSWLSRALHPIKKTTLNLSAQNLRLRSPTHTPAHIWYYRARDEHLVIKQVQGSGKGTQMINSIAHVSLITSDVERSLVFYCDILHFERDGSRPDLGYPGAWLNVGNQQIHLLQLTNPDPTTDRPKHGGRDRHTAFIINDLDQLIGVLTEGQTPYTVSKSGRRALFCRDPDGNALEFIEEV